MDSLADTYTTLAAPCEGSYSQQRSRFLAFAYPISNDDEAVPLVKKLKNKYHDARHVAYAYLTGIDGTSWRANDDGEPSGTAGKPILAAIRSKGLTDILIAVVRYYGGTPLGAKNLGRAYAEAADDALSRAVVKSVTITQRIDIAIPHPLTDLILRTARSAGAETRLEYTSTDVIAHIDVARSKAESLSEALMKIKKSQT